MPNFHQVFEKRSEPRCYRTRITPEEAAKNKLFEARSKIRRHLLRVIPVLTEQVFGKEGKTSPKFYTQGSWAYGTCNAPCHSEQEMDLDYGVYLPVSTWEDSGLPPQHAAKTYFGIIEKALKPLVEMEGWQFGEDKDTCVRIQISDINAHVDVPLYVAPDIQFKRLVEAMEALSGKAFDAARTLEFAEGEIDEQQWHEFEKIALAMRDGTWKDSDPRKVSDWFDANVKRYGEQLKRVCRYLKGMRDFNWPTGGPSSILLMICATKVWKGFDGRDDLALLHVLEHIGPLFLDSVHCQEISDEDFNRVKQNERHDVLRWAQRSASVLKDVVYHSRMHLLVEAFVKLQGAIDHRIETTPDLVTADTTPPSIRNYSPAVVPQRQHRESRAG